MEILEKIFLRKAKKKYYTSLSPNIAIEHIVYNFFNDEIIIPSGYISDEIQFVLNDLYFNYKNKNDFKFRIINFMYKYHKQKETKLKYNLSPKDNKVWAWNKKMWRTTKYFLGIKYYVYTLIKHNQKDLEIKYSFK